MNMKKNLSAIFLFILFASACSQDDLLQQSSSSNLLKFTASFEQNDSRTYIDTNRDLHWSKGDEISLFYGNTDNQQYLFDGNTGDIKGTFSPVKTTSNVSNNSLTKNYAVYPYSSNVKISENGLITATLPATQNYVKNSFGLGANTMVAITENTEDKGLNFKNVGGYLKLQLYGTDVMVKSITLTGNNNETFSGKATITTIHNGDPIVNMADDATRSITLDCGNGVKIGEKPETMTAFWIVLPPTEFENGFTIKVKDVNGKVFTQSTFKTIKIERNRITPMKVIEVIPEIPYLTFKAEGEQTLQMSKIVTTLEYSINKGKWEELGTNIIQFGGDKILQLRGKNSNGTATSAEGGKFAYIKFGTNTDVSCSGDILTLVNYEDLTNTNTSDARFCYLFSNSSVLISAPTLSIMTLADNCYHSMFNGCEKLRLPPQLPATNLAKSCYHGMFSGCKSLVSAPELPATNLAEECYANMFFQCSSLAQAPRLPATKLAQQCYRGMFFSTALIEAPELPASMMENYCYMDMFNRCFQLLKAPQLPAETLATGCYMFMFDYCKSLVDAPKLPAKTLRPKCYSNMFSNCTAITAAPALPATTLTERCYYGMFSGCTALISAPELSATLLAEGCYTSMFGDCTSLTTAPILPAKTLFESCYYRMFWGCNNLNHITMLATDIKTNSLFEWVKDVSSTGIFIKSENIESLPTGISGIPNEWTVKNYAEK